MLDTNSVSDIARGVSSAARHRLNHLREGESVCISVITEAELRYGMAKKPGARALHEAVEGFLAFTTVLPWGRDEAAIYGETRFRQQTSGRRLDELDLLIGCHALAAGAILVTRDKAFLQLEGLKGIENWATDLI